MKWRKKQLQLKMDELTNLVQQNLLQWYNDTDMPIIKANNYICVTALMINDAIWLYIILKIPINNQYLIKIFLINKAKFPPNVQTLPVIRV